MSLIQRNAVPLFILLAVIAVGVGMLLSRSPFAFGEEPVGCNVSTVGISILTTGEDGLKVSETYHGATITYRVILSIPELPVGDTACNYGGGSLSVVLPGGVETIVAGTEETGTIPTIQVGSPFTAPALEYMVDQGDATNMELTAKANYRGGSSFSVPEGETQPEATSSISNTVRIEPPSIDIEMTPEEPQLVYLGGDATFDITITNTGGFSLSNVSVFDPNAPDCVRDFASLAVDASENYQCTLKPGDNVINEATVIGQVVGGVPAEDSQVEDTDSSDVQVETVLIGIDIEPELQRVRIGNEATFTITVTIPGTTGLDNVTVEVPQAPNCDRTFATLDAGAVETYSCTASADPGVADSLPQGTHTILANVSGEIPDLATLTDTAQVVVEVFALDLFIIIDPEEQTIHDGDPATFTITVGNFGDTVLSDVTVTNVTVPECNNFFASLATGSEETYECTSVALAENLTTIADVAATAPDGGPVSASDSANVIILRPSTAIGLTELNTMVLRLVVQTLKVTETNDGDSPLSNICVEVDPTGDILPMAADAILADHCTGLIPGVIVLTKDSIEYVGGDIGDDGIMDIGETWEWRVITVGIAGDYVALAEDALNMRLVAVGYGTDSLGSVVTFPGDAEELGEIEVPIVTR